MALTFNTITVVGHVGNRRLFTRDDELTMVKLSVATNRKVDERDETTWFDVLCWGKTAAFVAEHVHQGELVVVEGTIVDRKDDEGRTWKSVHARNVVKTRALPPRDGGRDA